MSRLFAALSWCLILIYPFIVLFGLQVMSLQYIGIFLIALAGVRLALLRSHTPSKTLPMLLSLVLLLVAAHALLANEPEGLRLYPVAVNAVLLFVFAMSLRTGPSFVERLARIREPDLHPEAVEYTRKVTIVWCVFFVANGLTALYTALFSSFNVWAFYNGAVAYGLMGLLFGIEWIIRRRVKKTIHGST